MDLGPLAVDPTIYLPASQTADAFLRLVHTWFPPKWVIRTSGPAGALSVEVQRAVASVDPQLPLARFRSIDELQENVTSVQRYHAALFSILAGLALLLAAIGLYGLIAHSITERTHELGVRIALGATLPQVIAAVVRPGLLLAGAGVAAGYLISQFAVRWLEHMVWGVRPTDPATFLASAAILLAVTAAASIIPARRILRFDPARTLREE
jgi:ABC-type antimicrobial peptide transport system permease subunit